MSTAQFVLEAEERKDVGKGASRRLRRENRVIPAIVYGAHEEPKSIAVLSNELYKAMKHEAFYSHILTLKFGKKEEKVVLKDVQRHSYKPTVLHLDFQRVSSKEKITMRVPLHFLNEEKAIGVKQQGGIISHIVTDIEIKCLPADLPEFIEVDIAELEKDQSIHMSELKLPKGVELAHAIDENHDSPVVNIHAPKKAKEISTDENAEAASDDAEEGKKEEK